MTRKTLMDQRRTSPAAASLRPTPTPRRVGKLRLRWATPPESSGTATARLKPKAGPREHGLAHLSGEAVRAAEHVGSDALHAAEEGRKHAIRSAARAGEEVMHAARKLRTEPFWQAQAVLIGAVILYLGLPAKLIVGPSWLMPAVELLLVGGLWIDRPRLSRCEAGCERRIVLSLLGLVVVSNFLSLELLVRYLLHGGKAGGHQLLLSSVVIWITNVAVFALIFWQLDRGGPDRPARQDEKPPDFLFAQMTDQELAKDWSPAFVDYLYTSFTNATAFSPTDTLPLTSVTKLLMMSQLSQPCRSSRSRSWLHARSTS